MTAGLTARMSARLVERRRRQAGSQGGVALILVLGAIVLTSAVLLALFGLAVTSARVTTAQRDQARERRAASAAIESAIGQIARTDATDVCESLSPTADAQIQIRENPARPGIVVDVGCAETPWLAPGAPPVVVEQPQLASMSPNPSPMHTFGKVDMLTFDCVFNLPGCVRSRTFSTTWTATGTLPMESLYFLFPSNEGQNVHSLIRNLRIAVSNTAAGNCTVNVPGGRINEWEGAYTSVDLLADGCGAVLAGQPQSVLNGAKIDVTHTYVTTALCPVLCEATLRVGRASLLANVEVLGASSATGTGLWQNPADVLAKDTAVATIPLSQCDWPFTDERCRKAVPESVHSLNVGGFALPADSALSPEDAVATLGVLVDSRQGNPSRSWISDVIDETYFEIVVDTGAGGEPCAVKHIGFARSNQQSYVDLFTSVRCRELIQTVEDLTSATVTYSLMLNCAHDGDQNPAPIVGGRCASVTPPEIDRLALAVTTAPEPPSSLVTLTASVDGRVVTEADVYLDGTPGLPRATPVIAWRYGTRAIGPAPPSGP